MRNSPVSYAMHPAPRSRRQGSRFQNLPLLRLETLTGSSGVCRFPPLAPGTYELTIEASGFEKHTVSNLKLDVGARLAVDATLKVGNVSESVTVDASGIHQHGECKCVDPYRSTVRGEHSAERAKLPDCSPLLPVWPLFLHKAVTAVARSR